MSIRTITALCILFSCARVGAATADNYAYAWPLQTSGDSAAWQVELTPEVYAAIRSQDLRDVEVVNSAGDPVPLAPHHVGKVRTLEDYVRPLPLFVLPASAPNAAGDESISLHIERAEDGRLRRLDTNIGAPAANANLATTQGDLLLDASSVHDPITGLRIDWAGTTTVPTARFDISASDDLQHWRTLVSGATIMHLEQGGGTLRRHEIAFGETHAAYLRLHRVDNGPAFPNTGAIAVVPRTRSYSTPAQPALVWLDATLDGDDTRHLSPSTPKIEQHGAAYRYHLDAPLNIEAIRVELADDNATVGIEALSGMRTGQADDPSHWAKRAVFVAFRLRQDGAIIDSDPVNAFFAPNAKDWRLELNTPLPHAPKLSVAFRPDRFVFLAQGSGPYRLVAGSARAHRGDYPVDAALAQLRAKLGADWEPPLAAFGARSTLQGETAFTPAPPERHYDWKTWLLWAVLIGAAALIGGLALSLLRGSKSES
jgi:hypothetical protein